MTFRALTDIRVDGAKNSPFSDECYVERNSKYFAAVSLGTSRAGIGESPEEAYVDLLVGMVAAIDYGIVNQPDASLGISVGEEEIKSARKISCIDLLDQQVLIVEAKKKIKESIGRSRKFELSSLELAV